MRAPANPNVALAKLKRIGYACRLYPLKSFGRGFDSRHLHQPSLKLRLASRSFGEGCPPKSAGAQRRRTKEGNKPKMKYVYLLQSISHPRQRYVGLTNSLPRRLAAHNHGGSPYTSRYAPWHIVTAICFDDDQRASEFEQYLKTGSGRAFANKHLW